VDQWLIDKLKDHSQDIISIRENYSGISDNEVIRLAKAHKGLIITEDKDFGELIFSYNIRGCSVMLLRYGKSDFMQIEKNVFKALQHYEKKRSHLFMTITGKKIRIRKI
jgi:predicted nuclease of predicted toxin-antitoxin system